MNACKHGLGKLHIEFGTDTIEGAFEDFLQLHARLGVVVLAWQVNQTGVKPGVNVAAHKHARAGAIAQTQDAHRGVEQFVIADLE